jgi:hypothetical protein
MALNGLIDQEVIIGRKRMHHRGSWRFPHRAVSLKFRGTDILNLPSRLKLTETGSLTIAALSHCGKSLANCSH